ncbi:MAG: ferrous iron transport protein B [Hahellaceae bacterium]|nr:ferrous iron transport protein B [Hahellaceae bacterium]
MTTARTIGLIGNPNCGKTTLFNALTGTRQRVGNWPGVTVERKTGEYLHAGERFNIIDLPGTYSLISSPEGDSIDEKIAQNFVLSQEADLLVNVIDASSLERGLYLTAQLFECGIPFIVALNMVDVARDKGLHVDPQALADILGCPVVPLVASRGDGVSSLMDVVENRLIKGTCVKRPYRYTAEVESLLEATRVTDKNDAPLLDVIRIEHSRADLASAIIQARYQWVDQLIADVQTRHEFRKKSLQEHVDNLVLNRVLALPIFLGVMYLLFMFAINMGSAFVDFFDQSAAALFVEGPRLLLAQIHSPEWLTAFLADGIGGGMQLVASFIPVIACLFLALSFLEDVGYMARAAFIVDRMMRALGLPGKAFVPLIVGFGCNVPSVMAARTLNREGDRLVTSMMAPFMSCGARLTVYALFAAAFFPENGQNIVFALYLIGIAVAVLTAFLLRKFMLPAEDTSFIMELPPYLMPTARNLLMHTWHRLKGFVIRAGKAIIAVVMVLNLLSSIGTDGSFGHQNEEHSVLSSIGKGITPLFTPMGIDEDNWPATVGIFTGLFAKEVVVGTLDALYSAAPSDNSDFNLGDALQAALLTIPANIADVFANAGNPLGLSLGDLTDTSVVAEQQSVTLTTIGAMQQKFHGVWGAFSYLLFVLLYMPCVATVGAIIKEHGKYWAGFSMLWSFSLAYTLSVSVYQLANLSTSGPAALAWPLGLTLLQVMVTRFMLRSGSRQAEKENLIPLLNLS